jgi:hypothetical protein
LIFFLIKAHEKCKQIQGFVVEFSLEFLADDVLMPKWNTSEGSIINLIFKSNLFFLFYLGMAPVLLWT